MERSERLLDAGKAVLLIVDMQARLLEPIKVAHKITRNIHRLCQIAKTLEVPTLATTHNAEKLGGITTEFENEAWYNEAIDKLTFSCLGSDLFLRRFQEIGRPQVLLTGI
ncbi:MAG: isochorismatase family protein, partial [Fimbriimonadales bacterium]